MISRLVGWAVLLAATASLAQPSRNETLERTLREQLAARHPDLVATFDAATRALDAGDAASAATGFQRVAEEAPEFSVAHRRLCGALLRLERVEEAVGACEKAVEVERSFDNASVLARAWFIRGTPEDLSRTEAWARGALQAQAVGSEDWVEAKTMACEVAFRRDTSAGLQCADAFMRVAPESPYANAFGVHTAAMKGDWSDAFARLDKARPVLGEAEYQRLHALLEENQPFYLRWGLPWLELMGLWGLVFVTLVPVGWLLSRTTLAMARRLATSREEHTSSGARALRAVYRWVVALGSVFYYVSMPLVAATVLIVGGGAIYGFIALGRVPIKLVVIIGVLVATTVFAMVKSLFVRLQDEDPGEKLDWEKAPRLRKVLDETAAVVGTRPIDNVYLTPGTDVAVLERGGLLQRMRGTTERCLVLGVGVLDGFRVRPFKSVMAHEYGHFTNEDTAGGNLALRARVSLLRMGRALAESGNATWYNPAWWFFRGYLRVFLLISQGASRLQEVLADRRSIFAFGSRAFADGYSHVLRQSVRFDAYAQATLQEVIEGSKALANLYRFTPASSPAPDALEQAYQELLAAEPSPYDSHPASRDRLAWAAALDITRPGHADDEELVWSLFEDREQLEKHMTTVVRSNVAERHGVAIPAEAAA